MNRLFVASLLVVAVAACGKDKNTEPAASEAEPAAAEPPAEPELAPAPAAQPATADGRHYRHGTQQGAGTGGGEKKAEGEKIGAGGYKHGTQRGGGDGGGKKDATGEKTGKHPDHGSGKGAGTGGGQKDGEGNKDGVLMKRGRP